MIELNWHFYRNLYLQWKNSATTKLSKKMMKPITFKWKQDNRSIEQSETWRTGTITLSMFKWKMSKLLLV